MTKTEQPLAGIRVIELAQNLAGPFAGQILAQMGADVIKVERPGAGDDARGWGPPFAGDFATTFVAVNRGKRSLAVDMKDADARAWLIERIGEADIVVQNMRPGLLDGIGLGPAALTAKFPRLIYCSLAAFGAVGPKRLHPGYEPIMQGFSGIMMMNGAEGGEPTRSAPQILDLGTGMWGAMGILAALQRRHTTGRGGMVDVSLLETALGWMGTHFAGFSVTGRRPKRHPSGNPNTVVFQGFSTASAPMMVAAANNRLFTKLCEVLGRPDLGADARFLTNQLRVENKPALMAEIEPILRSRPAEEWIPALEASGIPCGPIHDMTTMAVEPQVAALGIVEDVPGLKVRAIGLPFSLDGVRPRAAGGVPKVDEHGEDIRLTGGWKDK